MDCEHKNTTMGHLNETMGKVLGQRIETCDDCGMWRTMSPTKVKGEWHSDCAESNLQHAIQLQHATLVALGVSPDQADRFIKLQLEREQGERQQFEALTKGFEGENHNGEQRQMQEFWYPDLPAIGSKDAVARMENGECWIRSVHTEFYYCYAVVEESKTGKRLLVKDIGICPAWKPALKFFLDNWS